MPFRCKCELLGRFGVALQPPWNPKGASVHFKPPFSRILSPKGTQSGTQKSFLGPQSHHLSLQSVSWSNVFRDLRSHPNLVPQITTKMWVCRGARHGWNIANNISKRLFPWVAGTFVFASFCTLFWPVMAPKISIVCTMGPAKRLENRKMTRLLRQVL